jgi:hypothetical protein
MSSEMMFMGHDADYWVALQARAESLNVVHLIEELSALYAKVGFYEKRIKEMAEFSGVKPVRYEYNPQGGWMVAK